MHELILIEKFPNYSDYFPNLAGNKTIPNFPEEEMVNKYQGFDGEFSSLFFTVKDKDELNKIIERCLRAKVSDYLLLYAISSPGSIHTQFQKKGVLMGFDVGVHASEKAIYSSIYNEILFGIINELISYKETLNEHLLFSDRHIAEKYLNALNEISSKREYIKDLGEMKIYEIWKEVKKQ
jgi:hypothetical protein